MQMQHVRESRAAARKLTHIGQKVIVTKDDGTEVESTIKQLPWELAHGGAVVGVNGFSGGYDCTRVRPAPNGQAEQIERAIDAILELSEVYPKGLPTAVRAGLDALRSDVSKLLAGGAL